MAETPESTGLNGVTPGELQDPGGRLYALDQSLRRSRPALAPDALGRVHGAMAREIVSRQRPQQPQRNMRWPAIAAVAALVLIGLCIGWQTVSIVPSGVKSARTEPPIPGAGIPSAELARRRAELLNQFRIESKEAKSTAIAADYLRLTPDAEIPTAEAERLRYFGALGLLTPHLRWRGLSWGQSTDLRKASVRDKLQREIDVDRASPWSEAHQGEQWMIDAMPKEARAQIKPALKPKEAYDGPAKPEPTGCCWTLDDPSAPDVQRSIVLLKQSGVPGARDWAAALARNNTVLTMDIRGGYASNQPGQIVLDARAAERVAFKLYRVREPEELLSVTKRIGWDFIFAEHENVERAKMMQEAMKLQDMARQAAPKPDEHSAPRLSDADLVESWTCDLATLDSISLGYRDGFDRIERLSQWDEPSENDDGEYFGDNCVEYSERIDKAYCRTDGEPTAWQCGKLVTIPATALKTSGAYILVAEANGQKAYAPIIADPLELALRRCRDGVLAVASERDSQAPLAGARIVANGMLQATSTDSSGVAFAKVFAGGDKTILAIKDGRCAIGGFGRLFDGVYGIPSWDDWNGWNYSRRRFRDYAQRARQPDQTVADVYEDRSVIAAYTDRPVYRPGQDVNFKLIVRLLGAATAANSTSKPAGFRAEDFDVISRLALPPQGAVAYEVLDPKTRAVAQGTLSLNDYGTSAGSIHLSAESATGAYALRVFVGGTPRIVPDVFAVKFYRTPNFEVLLHGSETLTPNSPYSVTISANYYFGKPLTSGKGHLRLVQADAWRPIAEADFTMNGVQVFQKLSVPAQLAGGTYYVICAVTDESGQTVTQSIAAKAPAPAATFLALSDLPRFVKLGEVLTVHAADRASVTARQWGDNAQHDSVFTVQNSVAALRFAGPGWWDVDCDGITVPVFVYGGDTPPVSLLRNHAIIGSEEPPDWVNLAVYKGEHPEREPDDDYYGDHRGYRAPDLWVLFDKHHAEVGGTLKVLVYAPGESPRIVFTYEGRTVVDYHIATLSGAGPYHVVELPIRERHLPNFYLQGCLLSGPADIAQQQELRKVQEEALDERADGDDPRWCRVDVVDPHGPHSGERLNVAVNSDRKDYHPGDTVGVDIRVTGTDGHPRAAEVSLSAVDESVYAFGEDKTNALSGLFASAHPDRLFLPKAWRIGSSANQCRNRQLADMAKAMDAQLDQAMEALKSIADKAERLDAPPDLAHPPLRALGEMPASEIPLVPWRNDFRETAAWLPQLRTGADGTLHTQFKLPDSLTRYRLTAVGLTQATEIGTAKSALTASLPLSVQVMLPRFAVEGDRLQATGLIHNNTAQPLTTPYRWEIVGATAEAEKLSGTVTIAAHASATVALPLSFDVSGQASVGLVVNPAANATPAGDAERRTLPVHPNGRPFEVAMNGAAGNISLPAGFVPTDLRLSLTRSNPWECLDGLGYLVDYPHGCVEQTMSRFLPAVVVKRAMQDGAAALPDDVIKRLPAVLETGLTRLYNFQHDDGGWGWWKEDRTNNAMTVYVLFGLARCKSAGTPVDESVLKKACAYIAGELSANRLDAELSARAWHALSLAGAADATALKALTHGPVWSTRTKASAGYLALACQNAGLKDDALAAWEQLKSWTPSQTDELALKLNLDVAFGALPDARATAAKLAAQRQGLRWNSTWDTSRAIEALAGLVQKLPPAAPARKIQVAFDGLPIFEAKTAGELAQRSFSFHAMAPALGRQPGAPISMQTDCAEPVLYALNATGYQRLDQVAASGGDVKMSRSYTAPGGNSLHGPVAVGQAIEVRVSINLAQPQSYLLIEDRRPAGFEYAADFLEGGDAKSAANVEFRDDRVCVYFGDLSAGEHHFSYYLRAETPGVSHVIPGRAYPMYNEKLCGETGADVLEVK